MDDENGIFVSVSDSRLSLVHPRKKLKMFHDQKTRGDGGISRYGQNYSSAGADFLQSAVADDAKGQSKRYETFVTAMGGKFVCASIRRGSRPSQRCA